MRRRGYWSSLSGRRRWCYNPPVPAFFRVHNFLGTLFIRIYSNQRPEAHAGVFECLYCSHRVDRQGESDGDTNRELRLGRVAELSSENVVVNDKLLVVAVE